MTDPVRRVAHVPARLLRRARRPAPYVFNSVKGRKERVGRLLKMHANKREEIKEVYAGDICAAVGLRDTTTGDTLCDEDQPIVLERMQFPSRSSRSRSSRRRRPTRRSSAARSRGSRARTRRSACRPTPRPAQTLISGHGRAAPRDHRRPPHARVQGRRERRQAAGRLPRDDPQGGRERDALRPADGRPRSVRPRRAVTVEPQAAGGGFAFVDGTKGGVIPREYMPAIEKGIKEALDTGVLAGYPVVDVKATVTYGSYHEVDSSEMAFKIAGSMCFKEAARQGRSGHPRAHHVARGGDAGGLHGRRHRRHQPPARPHQRPGAARQHAGDQRRRCRSRRCSATRRTCGHARRAARRSRCSSRTTSRCRRASAPRRSARVAADSQSPRLASGATEEGSHGQGEVRAEEAPRQRGDDRPHRPRQDHADRGDHEDAGVEGPQRSFVAFDQIDKAPGRARARHHDRDGPRRVRDRTSATTLTSIARATPTTSRT